MLVFAYANLYWDCETAATQHNNTLNLYESFFAVPLDLDP